MAIQSPHYDLWTVLGSLQAVGRACNTLHLLPPLVVPRALTSVRCMQLLVLKIGWLDFNHTTAVSGLHSSVPVQLVFKDVHYNFFGLPFFVPSFLSCIMSLVLTQADSRVCQRLNALTSLKDLCVIRGQDMTGEEFTWSLPTLTSSRLTSCFCITDKGLHSMMTAMARLQQLVIQREENIVTPRDILSPLGTPSFAAAAAVSCSL